MCVCVLWGRYLAHLLLVLILSHLLRYTEKALRSPQQLDVPHSADEPHTNTVNYNRTHSELQPPQTTLNNVLCICLSVSVCLSLYISLSVALSLSLSHSLPVSISIFPPLSLPLSLVSA